MRPRRRSRPGRAGRRGFTALLALSVVAALGVLVAVGLDRRTDDLAFDGRSLCRVAARAAAESAIARAEAQLDAGRRPDAHLEGRLAGGDPRLTVTYALRATGAAASATFAADGTCALRDGTTLTRHVDVELAREGGRWIVTRWAE